MPQTETPTPRQLRLRAAGSKGGKVSAERSTRDYKAFARSGGIGRTLALTPEQRSESARRAGKASAVARRKKRAIGQISWTPTPAPALTPDAARSLYREAKANRLGRDAELVAEAKRIFDAQLAEAAQARKGGRPPKIRCGKALASHGGAPRP